MKKVRYLTVCRSSIEVVSKLTEHEKALFVDILYSAFKQIEAGEPVTVPAVDGVLSVILDDAIAELESGFATYMKRVNARNKADQADQEPPEPVTNHRPINDSINDPSPTDNRREEKRIEKNKKESSEESNGEGNGGNRLPGDQEQLNLQAYQLQTWLNRLQIPVDADILNAWKEYGFDAIRSAVHRFDNVTPPVKKSVFIDLVREEGNRL